MLHAYLATYEVHGPIYFSSRVEPSASLGSLHVTSPYISSVPLTYALNGMSCDAYGGPSGEHFHAYAGGRAPSYEAYNRIVRCISSSSCGDRVVYAYPAEPVEVRFADFTLSAKYDTYADIVGAMKVVYPRRTAVRVLAPTSRLRGLVVSTTELPSKVYARIGAKRWGVVVARLAEAKPLCRLEGGAWSSVPVNLGDVAEWGYRVEGFIEAARYRTPLSRGGRVCWECSVVGYVEAEGMFVMEARVGRIVRIVAPLPRGSELGVDECKDELEEALKAL